MALANLIDLYATSDMNLETRHQLCILLVEQVNQSAAASVIEPGLQTLRRSGPTVSAVDIVLLSEAYVDPTPFFDDARRVYAEHFASARSSNSSSSETRLR